MAPLGMAPLWDGPLLGWPKSGTGMARFWDGPRVHGTGMARFGMARFALGWAALLWGGLAAFIGMARFGMAHAMMGWLCYFCSVCILCSVTFHGNLTH